MKKITKYLVVCLAALALVGCKDKMRELNSNPNTIESTDARYMFMSAMQNYDYSNRDAISTLYSSTGVLMQYFVHYEGATNGKFCNDAGDSWMSPGTLGPEYEKGAYDAGKQMDALRKYVYSSYINEVDRPKYADMLAIAGIVEVSEFFRVFQNYGAAVYSQAFRAAEGILKPEYDIFDLDIYLALDARVKEYVAVLATAEPNEGTIELGVYDPIYGYVTQATGAPKKQDKYEIQRNRWKMYGNTVRLNMAWIMGQVAGNLDDVLSETIESGLFESAADGAFTHYNGPGENNDVYNSDGTAQISVYWSMTDNFIQYLKAKSDPRTPLLVRNNDVNPYDPDYAWIKAYFPDSLKKHKVYKNDVWAEENWSSGQLDHVNPWAAYQGQNADPEGYDQEGPGLIWGDRSFTFNFFIDKEATKIKYKIEDGKNEDGTVKLKEVDGWEVYRDDTYGVPQIPNGKGVLKDAQPIDTVSDWKFNRTLNLASRPQGRYFVSMGGKSFADGDANAANGYDGSIDNRLSVYYTRPIYTYPEQCFLMSLLALEKGALDGKSAAEWYKEGIREAMEELQLNAVRYQVQVAYSRDFSTANDPNEKIVGVNETEVYNLNATKINNYISNYASGAPSVEDIAGQVWIYSYNNSANMWNWWRKTGYPEFKTVDALSDPERTSTEPYFTQPTTRDGSQQLQIPRRGALRQPRDVINNANYNATQAKLEALTGYEKWNKTTGRVFWDK